ncbi:MAG: hypothetical protein P8Y69_10885, partial [Gammaproteobacteria bacterium]
DGPGGTASGSVTITVIQPLPAPTVNLTAQAASIERGTATTLNWGTTNATSCNASGAWSGNRSVNGSASTGALSTASTFTLTCSGAGGTASDSVSVQVTDPLPDAPAVSLTVDNAAIDAGASTTLRWSATNATTCTASDGWSGSRAVTGSQTVSPSASTSYTLTCTGDGGSDSATVTVTVNSTAPTLSFTASDTVVDPGGSVTLNWSATDVTGCSASGGWSGARGASGSELVGPIDASTTFSLSCTGPGGNVIEMLTVSTVNAVPLSWVAPTENVDGSTLTDLAGYRIYWGTSSRTYTDMEELTDPQATSHTLSLVSGDYFVAMTALDAQGNESAYSNEVVKTSP